MIPITLSEIAAALSSSLVGGDPDAVIDTVVVDSRLASAGALFLAVVGETHDGHDYVEQALAAGATAALVSRPVPGPHILVEDTVAAAGVLARHLIDGQHHLQVVALTGSSGKTSTKDMLRVMLSAFAPTVAPQGSFNNELGLPRTVFEITQQTRYLVAEMGARGAGHIAYLCGIAPPHVSLFLNVGHAHLSEFGTREGIASAKGEILAALGPAGVAVLNADDSRVMEQAGRAPGRVVTFGQAPGADVRITDLALAAGKPVVTLQHGDDVAVVRLGVHGEHQALNLAAAVATAVDPDDCLSGRLGAHRDLFHRPGGALGDQSGLAVGAHDEPAGALQAALHHTRGRADLGERLGGQWRRWGRSGRRARRHHRRRGEGLGNGIVESGASGSRDRKWRCGARHGGCCAYRSAPSHARQVT